MNAVIYCFTGPGNSLKVARELAGKMRDTKLVRICRCWCDNLS